MSGPSANYVDSKALLGFAHSLSSLRKVDRGMAKVNCDVELFVFLAYPMA